MHPLSLVLLDHIPSERASNRSGLEGGHMSAVDKGPGSAALFHLQAAAFLGFRTSGICSTLSSAGQKVILKHLLLVAPDLIGLLHDPRRAFRARESP